MEAKKRQCCRKETLVISSLQPYARLWRVAGTLESWERKPDCPRGSGVLSVKMYIQLFQKLRGKKRSLNLIIYINQNIKRRQLEWCSEHTIFSASTLSWKALKEAYKIQLHTNVQDNLRKVSLSPLTNQVAVPKPSAFLLPPIINQRLELPLIVGWCGM